MTRNVMMVIVIAVVGLLIFGNRLPEVGRSLGKSIIEFKKGIRGIQDEIDPTESVKKNNNIKD